MRSAMILTICLALFGVLACWGAEQGTQVDTTVEKKETIIPTQKAKASKKRKDTKNNANISKGVKNKPAEHAPASPPKEKSMRIPSKGEPVPDGMRVPTKGEQTPDGMRIPTKGEN